MPEARRGWFGPAVALVGAVVLFRLALLPFAEAEVFVDEAQYWLWGQSIEFGYYSKPPLIGWVLRAVTELAGSDSAFWLRAPAAVFHGATALILGGLAAELWGRREALAVAATYITLPLVSVGSFLISTDTIMFPFLAVALWAWVRVLHEKSGGAAVLAGVALGAAVMAKYAGVYYVLCAALAALAMPAARPAPRHAVMALVAAIVVISPNILWNIQNGLSTFEHTMDNADWVRDPGAKAALNWGSLGEFFASQFIVFGPLCLGALIWAVARWKRQEEATRLLLWFAVPIVLLVCGQALLSKAYANWAAAAYLAASLVAAPALLRAGRLWIGASLAIGAAFAVILPLATTQASHLSLDGKTLLLGRYVGREAMSTQVFELAEMAGVSTVVADDRDVLADLVYRVQGQEVSSPAPEGVAVFAKPQPGRPPNHYVQHMSYPGGAGEVLFVTGQAGPPACEGATEIGTLQPTQGAYRKRPQAVWLVPGDCWAD